MRKITSVALASALALAPVATVASAQSGYDTGAGKNPATTTNSGEARPDATTADAPGGKMARPDKAAPTSGSGGSGSGMKRPDADPNSAATGGAVEPAPKKAAPADTKN
ncbi:hypothetical protein [Methylopila sp. M107]|uniref:hypothetical protein n=1 Tax=Methylopila sp. M107 TaxID=1101190 RepID=UPI00036F3B71|nr:hypothetical protein [Methylopila sp. M107]